MNKNGFITREELRRALQKNGFHATESDLQCLMERYDRNGDSRISYSEFMEEILPKSPTKV